MVKIFDVAKKTKRATVVWFVLIMILAVITAIKGGGWEQNENKV